MLNDIKVCWNVAAYYEELDTSVLRVQRYEYPSEKECFHFRNAFWILSIAAQDKER